MSSSIPEAEKERRIRRLEQLIEHADFDGSHAELGRALGYKDGGNVRHMLNGRRPISEKTIRAIETMRGGKFAGWFRMESAITNREPWPLDPFVTREAWMQLLPEERAAIAWEAGKVLSAIRSARSGGGGGDLLRKPPAAAA